MTTMEYNELLEKYKILEDENRILKEEIKLLKMKSVAECPTEYVHEIADAVTLNNQISSDQ